MRTCFQCVTCGGTIHMLFMCGWHEECRFRHIWIPLYFLECICFCCCVWCVFIRDSSFQMFVKFIFVGPHAMKTQFRTQPIWFGGVEDAFHMRYLSGQCASVVTNCSLFGLLWWIFFQTFSWPFGTHTECVNLSVWCFRQWCQECTISM